MILIHDMLAHVIFVVTTRHMYIIDNECMTSTINLVWISKWLSWYFHVFIYVNITLKLWANNGHVTHTPIFSCSMIIHMSIYMFYLSALIHYPNPKLHELDGFPGIHYGLLWYDKRREISGLRPSRHTDEQIWSGSAPRKGVEQDPIEWSIFRGHTEWPSS